MEQAKVVLATFGTHGDLNPFIAIALELQRQGFLPIVATSADYQAKVAAAGIRFHEVRPSLGQIRHDLRLDDAAMFQRAAKDPAFLFRDVSFPYLRPAYEDMLPVLQDARLVLTSTLTFSARLAAEKCGVPQMGVALQPIMFVSAYDPAMNPHAVMLSKAIRHLGPRVTAGAVWVVKKVSEGWAAPLAAFRKELGLPPDPRNLIFDAQFSSHGTLGLYSPVLGALQPDYPPNTQLTGFAFYDDDPEEGVATQAALADFVAAGPSPIAFVLGSAAHVNAGDFFDVSIEAARALGRRAVVVTGSASPRSSQEVFACRYARYSQLFPGAAAIVHQGGIGTVAQALRAGRPQIVVPFHGDQLDNGTRVERLGAGRVILRPKYRKERAVAELERVLSEPGYSVAAARIAEQVQGEDGAAQAVAAIRRMLSAVRQVNR